MKTLFLNFRTPNIDNYDITLNDKKVKFKRNNLGQWETAFQTEESKVSLRIKSKPLELDGKFWLLKYLLYFIVSLFGIFDSWYRMNYYTFDYNDTIELNEDKHLDITINKGANNDKAVVDNTGTLKDNDSNKYVYRKDIKKRKTIAMLIKYISWILIAISIVLIIVL